MTYIKLPDSDDELLALCEVQTFRASGKGGQHINTTNSAVRIIYRPLNLAVTCQEERSQLLNKKRCLEKLRQRIAQLNYKRPKRISTRISRSQKERDLDNKSKQSDKKRLRRKPISYD